MKICCSGANTEKKITLQWKKQEILLCIRHLQKNSYLGLRLCVLITLNFVHCFPTLKCMVL